MLGGKEKRRKSRGLPQLWLVPLTDSFGGQISSSSFSLAEGMESCLIFSSLWTGREKKSEIKSDMSENNSQGPVRIIITFLIIVLCCCDNKTTRVYFLNSCSRCQIMETINCCEEITLTSFCTVTHRRHNLNDRLHYEVPTEIKAGGFVSWNLVFLYEYY